MTMMTEDDLVDISAQIVSETEDAYRLFDGRVMRWVPKAQCQNNEDGSFTMPVWLAVDRWFV